MEYHFVVKWSEENGWQLDWDTLDAVFPNGSVYAPNLNDWLMPVHDSETGDKEDELTVKLNDALQQLNK